MTSLLERFTALPVVMQVVLVLLFVFDGILLAFLAIYVSGRLADRQPPAPSDRPPYRR